MNILSLAQQRIPDLKKKTANEWAGPCPGCGGTDRFLVWTHREAWHCRGCGKSGDAIEFLRQFDGCSCPEAHEQLGIGCDKSGCAVWDKCRLGSRAHGGVKTPRQVNVDVPAPETERTFNPDQATPPEHRWQHQAEILIKKAHAALLENPEQLDYLNQRGLPLEAVQRYQLGWLPANRYPARATWGLPAKLRDDGKPKKLFIPSGLLIPFFDADDQPHRIRIRRNDIRPTDGRYYWLDGSGNDVPVIGAAAKAFVVVESDLDALMIHHQAGDLVGTVPLGSCSPKPKQSAMKILTSALALLISLDSDQAGAKSANWWMQQFQRASRWPVPAGKDPGEYYQDHDGDIRAWALAGLPPAFHVATEIPISDTAPALPTVPEHAKGQTINGHDYVVAYHAVDVSELQDLYKNAVVFSPHEINQLKGMSPENAEKMLLAKKIFSAQVSNTGPVPADYPYPPELENNQLKPQQEELIL